MSVHLFCAVSPYVIISAAFNLPVLKPGLLLARVYSNVSVAAPVPAAMARPVSARQWTLGCLLAFLALSDTVAAAAGSLKNAGKAVVAKEGSK